CRATRACRRRWSPRAGRDRACETLPRVESAVSNRSEKTMPLARCSGSAMAYTLEHRTSRGVARGLPYPLGATLAGTGVNFALYSKHADDVFLLLFDAAAGDPTDVIRLDRR